MPDYKVITTEDGQNAGFATYVEGLLDMAQGMGLKVTFNARIVQLVETGSGFQLMTEAGAVRPPILFVHNGLFACSTSIACGLFMLDM